MPVFFKNSQSYFTRIALTGCILLVSVAACHKVQPEEIHASFIVTPVPGSMGSSPLSGKISIQVVNSMSAKPVPGSIVYIYQGSDSHELVQLTTDKDGACDWQDERLTQPVTLTVVSQEREAYDTMTLIDANAASVIIPLKLRKKPPERRIRMAFEEFTEAEYNLRVFTNEQLKISEPLRSAKGKSLPLTNPYPLKIPLSDVFWMAVTLDKTGVPSRWASALIGSDQQVPGSLPCSFKVIEPDEAKKVRVEFAAPEKGSGLIPDAWQTTRDLSVSCSVEAGIIGPVSSGIAAVVSDHSVDAYIIRSSDLTAYRIDVTACPNQRTDQMSSTRIYRYAWDELPQSIRVEWKEPPSNPIYSYDPNRWLRFSWDSEPGHLNVLTIYHPKYDFNWTIYSPASRFPGSIAVPRLPAGSIGMMLPGEIYSACIEVLLIPEFHYESFSFQDIWNRVIEKTRSASIPISVPETGP